MKIGFTGTQKGMTKRQRSGVSYYLWFHGHHKFGEAHHGDCIGADAEFHYLATKLGLTVFKHPALGVSGKRAFCAGGTELPAKPPLVRNRDIVDSVDIMIAAPAQSREVLRSGTWATIRYAKKVGRAIHIVYPS